MLARARRRLIQPYNTQKGILREGIVATRCGSYGGLVGGWTYVNSRTGHVAITDIRKLKIIETWCRSEGVIELETGNPGTIRAAIEYPSGVYSQIPWSGGTDPITGVIVNSRAESDYAQPQKMIPAGATFWIRKWINAPNGIECANPNFSSALGDGISVSGSVLPDLTMGGAIGNAGGVWMPTAAIIGMTPKATVILTGDSITAGQADDLSNISDYRVGIVAHGFPSGLFGFLNHGVGGASTIGSGSTSDYIATTAIRQTLWKYGTHFVSGLCNNDIFIDGRSAATTLSLLQTKIWPKFPAGARVYQITCTPRSTSTDSWKTGSPQQTTNGNNSVKNTFNGLIRAGGIVGMDGFLETAWAGEDAHDSGLWNYDGVTANLYTSDGTHGSPTGYATMAAAVYDATKYVR